MINGPINVVRMEGTIGKIKKVIYLFMDIHLPFSQQTECDDVLSKDIKDYFVDKFRNVDDNKTIDFFVESMALNIYEQKSNEFKDIYIRNVIRFMAKAFEKKGSKVIQNKLFPTIRFHHMDPRDYFEGQSFENLSKLSDFVAQIWNSKHFFPNDTKMILQILQNINKDVEFVYQYLFKEDLTSFKKDIKKKDIVPTTQKDFDEMTQDDYDVQVFSIIKKIRGRYENKNVMTGINEITKKHSKAEFDKYFELGKEIEKLLPKINDIVVNPRVINDKFKDPVVYGTDYVSQINYLAELDILVNKFYDQYIVAFVSVMDLYFLRRFLDKNYITNVVAYTGSLHSVNYIFYLRKYFGFKVTHYDNYNKNTDVNAEIMKATRSTELEILFYPKILKQCSNLSNFPKNFD